MKKKNTSTGSTPINPLYHQKPKPKTTTRINSIDDCIVIVNEPIDTP